MEAAGEFDAIAGKPFHEQLADKLWKKHDTTKC